MRDYLTPDFDVTVYEVEDIITVSITRGELDDNGSGDNWWNG